MELRRLTRLAIQLTRQEDLRLQVLTAIGDRGDHGDKLQGRNRFLLPDGYIADGGRLPVFDGTQQPSSFTRQRDTAALAESEGANVFVETLGSEHHGYFDHAHVAGAGQRSGRSHCAHSAIALVIMDNPAEKIDLAALAVDHRVRRDQVLVQRGRIADQLECRAGLVYVAYGTIDQFGRRDAAGIVGIEAGPDGEGQNLAGVHILNDDGSVLRLRFLHGVIERLLRHELDISVDGKLHVLPRLRIAL